MIRKYRDNVIINDTQVKRKKKWADVLGPPFGANNWNDEILLIQQGSFDRVDPISDPHINFLTSKDWLRDQTGPEKNVNNTTVKEWKSYTATLGHWHQLFWRQRFSYMSCTIHCVLLTLPNKLSRRRMLFARLRLNVLTIYLAPGKDIVLTKKKLTGHSQK